MNNEVILRKVGHTIRKRQFKMEDIMEKRGPGELKTHSAYWR